MSFENNPRFKDPFSSSPLPKSFYHPTRTKDVDINVAIQSQDKKDQLHKRSNMEKSYQPQPGSTFRFAPLPQLRKVVSQEPSKSLFNDEYDETLSNGEQSSHSTLLQTSQLTSSIDEIDVVNKRHISHQERLSHTEDGSISLIQKYIDRFRYSAPKSREERKKENSSKSNNFWWLNSDIPNQQMTKLVEGRITRQSPGTHVTPSNQESGSELTREAIFKLDQETSYLQQKADKLLSKSQLSLASSGPCVSTDGLGSTSALSDYTCQTDPQPSYRPIFVNVQGECPRLPLNDKFDRVVESDLHPNDVLARWRMRRKVEDSQPKNNKDKYRPMQSHLQNREMDVRLKEFRKKLFAQRVLVTTEDIQFERQKMKMMIEDETDQEQQKIEKQQDKTPPHSSLQPNEDVVLARLRQITGSSSILPHSVNISGTDLKNNMVNLSEVKSHDSDQQINHLESKPSGSNARITQQGDNKLLISSSEHHMTDNSRNVTLNETEHRCLKNIENNYRNKTISESVSNAKQKSFSPSTSESEVRDATSMKIPTSKHKNRVKDISEGLVSGEESALDDSCMSEGNIIHDSEMMTPFHQRLQAEKPCDESDSSNVSAHKDHRKKSSNKDKKNNVSKSGDDSVKNVDSSDNNKRNSEFQFKRQKVKHPTNISIKSSKSSEIFLEENKSPSSDHCQPVPSSLQKNVKNENCEYPTTQCDQSRIPKHIQSDISHTKLPCISTESNDRSTGAPYFPMKTKTDSLEIAKSTFARKQSPQNNIHRVIGETVVDHLFDGPSMISSVDSWASLFPQSPAHSHSFYNSTVVTPTKDASSCDCTSTPHGSGVLAAQDVDNSVHDSDDEFPHDPLMNLLRQQKKDYLHKLELIESTLQQLEVKRI